MKKRIWRGCVALAVLLFLSSCQNVDYEAYVTVVNIGNMEMNAWVDGDGVLIKAYDSLTWAVPLKSKDESLQLHLEAEPVGGGDYDDTIVILRGDRDIVTWLAGWDLVGSSAQKRESSVIHGPAPK